jgi:hypothetical protein
MFQPTADELRRRSEPRTKIVARDDRLLSLGALLEHPWSSQVHWVRWTDDEAEARIDEVLEFFRRQRLAFVWLVTAKSTPASLGSGSRRVGSFANSRAGCSPARSRSSACGQTPASGSRR